MYCSLCFILFSTSFLVCCSIKLSNAFCSALNLISVIWSVIALFNLFSSPVTDLIEIASFKLRLVSSGTNFCNCLYAPSRAIKATLLSLIIVVNNSTFLISLSAATADSNRNSFKVFVFSICSSSELPKIAYAATNAPITAIITPYGFAAIITYKPSNAVPCAAVAAVAAFSAMVRATN